MAKKTAPKSTQKPATAKTASRSRKAASEKPPAKTASKKAPAKKPPVAAKPAGKAATAKPPAAAKKPAPPKKAPAAPATPKPASASSKPGTKPKAAASTDAAATGTKGTAKAASGKKTAPPKAQPQAKPKPKAGATPTPTAAKGPGKAAGKPESKAGTTTQSKAPAKADPTASEPVAPPSDGPAGDDKKPGRKGITIVHNKPAAKPKPVPGAIRFAPPTPKLLGPDSPLRRPLITSGPNAPKAAKDDDGKDKKPRKSPLTPKQLEHYRAVLLAKRAELIGDVQTLEDGALRSQSGGLSSLPQHLAEQGTDSADQTLNLNLAAADRKLIREIDDALARIADGTYGVCELTGNKIAKERLDELPWTRHSIEGARLLERGGMTANP